MMILQYVEDGWPISVLWDGNVLYEKCKAEIIEELGFGKCRLSLL
jgi:hypothetical protein